MPIVWDRQGSTHSHSSGTSEQTVFTITSTNINLVKGIWLDMSNLTKNMVIRVKYQIDGSSYRTFQTINWTTGMDDGVVINGDLPIDDNFRLTLQSTVAEGASRDVNYEYFTEGIGRGATTITYTVTDSVTNDPLAQVEVRVTTDASGNNVVASGTTNTSGQVVFYLDDGTYYFWRERAGYNFTNPDSETVVGA